MSNTSNTLKSIIAASFDGNNSALAKVAGVSPATITKLTSGTLPNQKTLKSLCRAMLPNDARHLCLAMCMDTIPDEYRADISITMPTSDNSTLAEEQAQYITGPQLDDHSERIICKLRELAAREPETKAWLARIGKWVLNE